MTRRELLRNVPAALAGTGGLLVVGNWKELFAGLAAPSGAGQASRPSRGAVDELSPLELGRVKVAGEIGRRINITVENSLLNLNFDSFITPFREKKAQKNLYVGTGLLLDATVHFAAYSGDERVVALKRRLVKELLDGQEADGYLGAFQGESRVWGWLDIQELAYLLYGLINDYRLFKEDASLDAARKQADYILARWEKRPSGSLAWYPLHMTTTNLDRAMFALAELTGDRRYKDFCIRVLKVPDWNDKIILGYWNISEGHVYAYLARCVAQLDWYRAEPNEALLAPTRRALTFMQQGNGMVVTGQCGDIECWHDTQAGTADLAETCSTAYVLRVLDSMLRLTGNSEYGDIMERTIYNGLFGAQTPDGRRIRYFTSFEGPRTFWLGELSHLSKDTYCCPNNYRRIIAELPGMVYYRSRAGVAVNLYTASSGEIDLPGGVKVSLRQETDYPTSGNVTVQVDPSRPAEFPLSLRVPRWCSGAEVAVNGKRVEGPVGTGKFFTITRTWRSGDRVELHMPMSWRLVKGRVAQAGRIAILRGPVVFCLNPARHPSLAGVNLRLLTLDLSSLEGPFPDHSVRPGGLSCKVRAWGPGLYAPRRKTDTELVLTEFPDPGGEAIYFHAPNPNAPELVHDELMRVSDERKQTK